MIVTESRGSTIPALLRARCEAHPERVAILVDGTRGLTFGEWETRSDATAGVLQHEMGVRRGDYVGLFFDTHEWLEYAIAYCAVLKTGAAALHLGPRMNVAEVQRRLVHCDVAGVISGTLVVSPEGPGWRAYFAELAGRSAPPVEGNVQPEDISDILYTSGTTGLPKGVRVSHGNNTFGREVQVRNMFEKSGHFLGPFPTGTSSAQAMINFAFSGGPVVLVMTSIEPRRILAMIEQCRVDNLMVAPATALEIINSGLAPSYDLSSVRMVSSGSAYMSPATTRAISAIFPLAAVLTHYGATEAVPAIIYGAFDPQRPTSLGRPGPGTEIVICDPDGERLPARTVGEIWLRCAAPPRAFHKDPERDARIYTGGWTRMGDLGLLDADGSLHLFDRAADVIRRNGKLVSSLQIEGVLSECPHIRETAVLGLPDPTSGEVVAAAIVLKAGAAMEDVLEFIDLHLTEEQMPAVIRQFDALPRGTIWKVLKRELRGWFQPGSEQGTLIMLAPTVSVANGG